MKKLLVITFVLCGLLTGVRAAEKPNILVILTDDQRADCVGAVNPRIRTPNMDRIAAQGVLFNNAYIMGGTAPAVCTPSRVMLMSGRTLFHLPKDVFAKGDKPSVPVMSTVFRKAGYDTFYCGKHDNTYLPADRSFDKTVVFNHEVSPSIPKAVARNYSFTKQVVDYLGDPARKQKPFFIFFAPPIPHDPLYPEPDDLKRYTGANLPPLPPTAATSHAEIAGFNLRDTNIRPYRVPGMGNFKTPLDLRQWPEVLARYYAYITSFDRQVGLILDELKRTGADKNTIIVFSSDNGHSFTDQGLIHKQSVYEQDLRVPLIVSGPGIPANQRSDALVNINELFPTLCELIGVPVPKTVETKSFRPVLADPSQPGHTTMYYGYCEEMRALRDGRYKVILFDNGQVRLFDLKDDPLEMHDLSKDPAQINRVAAMVKQARATGKALDDDPKNAPPGRPFHRSGGWFWKHFDANEKQQESVKGGAS